MKKFSKGFTLIEFIVVIVLIGIIAAVAVPRLTSSAAAARAAALTGLKGAVDTAVTLVQTTYKANNDPNAAVVLMEDGITQVAVDVGSGIPLADSTGIDLALGSKTVGGAGASFLDSGANGVFTLANAPTSIAGSCNLTYTVTGTGSTATYNAVLNTGLNNGGCQ